MTLIWLRAKWTSTDWSTVVVMGKNKKASVRNILLAIGCLFGLPVFPQTDTFSKNFHSDRQQSYEGIWVEVGGKLALCSGSEKGSISLVVGGGKPPYTFRWNTNETTPNRSNLNAGTYTVWIKDSEGWIHEESIVIQPPFPLVLNPLIKKDATCGSAKNGYAKISVKLGRNDYEKDSPPYQVNWSNGLKNVWEADNLAPGTYVVKVGDKYNCETSISFEIKSESPGISVVESIKNVFCKGQTTGEIILNVAGGVAPYTYKWNNGFQGKDLTNVGEGVYQVTITDGKGCGFQGTYTVKSTESIDATASIISPSCNSSNDGKISINPSGGIPPYTIQWNDGSVLPILQNLGEGKYSVKITDALGCTLEKEFLIKAQSQLKVSLVNLDPVTCFGEMNGSISIGITGAAGSFKIKWEDDGSDVLERKNLKAGTYKVSVSDESNCTVTSEIEVREGISLQAKIESAVEKDCDLGKFKGRAWVSVSGGKAPYTFHWLTSNLPDKEIEFEESGILKVKITDAVGCSIEVQTEVSLPESNREVTSRINFDYRKLVISDESEVFEEEEIIFEPDLTPEIMSWEWDFGDGKKSGEKSPKHVFEQAGTYRVNLTVKDKYGCTSTHINQLEVVAFREFLIVPNAFSPNGDKLNDIFFPKMSGIKELRFQVFNNWGELLYISTTLENLGWDGTYNGQMVPMGNYIYKIDYTDKKGIKKSSSGTVLLIR